MSCDVGKATEGLENVCVCVCVRACGRVCVCMGGRVIGISGSLIWSKTLIQLIFNPCGEFR